MPRVLVVDDEPAIRNTLSTILPGVGLDVDTALDGETALQKARETRYDLIILDLRLPGLDGVEVCRRLRKQSQLPILMLTGLGEEMDKVLGLEAGADDYLTKPFGGMELLARVRALLRRAPVGAGAPSRQFEVAGPQEPLTARVRVGDLEIDLIERKVSMSGHSVKLSHREFELLSFLARHPGQAFPSAHLLKKVWGYEDTGDTRTVLVHVRWLRQKLEEDPSAPRLIETVRGSGYRLRA